MILLKNKNTLLLLLLFTLVSCSTTAHRESLSLSGALESIKEDNDKEKHSVVAKAFVEKTNEYGLQGVKAYNFNIVDINLDGYSDIVIIPSFYSEPLFYYFNPTESKFVLGESLFSKGIKASFLMFYDLNKDTNLDVIVGVLNQKSELSKDPIRVFLGKVEGKKLRLEETKLNLKTSPNASIGLVDYDLDGQLDMYVGNWFSRYKESPIPHPDQLLVMKNGKYLERTDLLVDETKQNLDKTMYVNATPTYSVQVCDMDQNGFPDILTTSTNRYKNKLWLSQRYFRDNKRFYTDFGGESQFASDTDGLINQQGGGRTFGLACADYNNDGIMDVFLGELSHNYDHDGIDKSSILTGRTIKKTPRFFRTEYFVDSENPNWHQADRRGIWVDLDNDGLLDLIVDNSGYPPHSKMIIFKQHSDHSFENVAENYGIDITNPIGTVIADFNKDGRMDILSAQSSIRDDSITPQIRLFENAIDVKKSRSIRVTLRGQNSNFHGLNAMIILKVETNSGLIERRQYVSYSYGALPPQNEEGMHFVLNDNEKLVDFTVRWPFSKKLNVHPSELEVKYEINIDNNLFIKKKSAIDITLCESGKVVFNKKSCH